MLIQFFSNHISAKIVHVSSFRLLMHIQTAVAKFFYKRKLIIAYKSFQLKNLKNSFNISSFSYNKYSF